MPELWLVLSHWPTKANWTRDGRLGVKDKRYFGRLLYRSRWHCVAVTTGKKTVFKNSNNKSNENDVKILKIFNPLSVFRPEGGVF